LSSAPRRACKATIGHGVNAMFKALSFTVATHSYCGRGLTILRHCNTKPIAGEMRACLKW